MKESTITRRALEWLNKQEGCYAIKLHGDMYVLAGTPDILAVYRGRAILIEMKREGGAIRSSQQHQMDLWEKAGAVTAVCYSLEDVQNTLWNDAS